MAAGTARWTASSTACLRSGSTARLLIALLRAARVAWHLAHGLLLVSFRFSGCSIAAQSDSIQRWSARLLDILAIRLDLSGSLPHSSTVPAMLVANHVSWLDIYALNAVCPAQFVAKSEIARWPLLGRFARKAGTVFIERTRKRDILRVNRELAAHMRAGTRITVFAEGTTTAGDGVLPFRPALLQAAIACEAQVYAVAIRYERLDGSLCREAAFTGDTSLGAALWLVLKQPAMRVHLQLLPAVPSRSAQRKRLARETRQRVASALHWRAAVMASAAHAEPACPHDFPIRSQPPF